jgi:hypothetical protein
MVIVRVYHLAVILTPVIRELVTTHRATLWNTPLLALAVHTALAWVSAAYLARAVHTCFAIVSVTTTAITAELVRVAAAYLARAVHTCFTIVRVALVFALAVYTVPTARWPAIRIFTTF